MHGKSCTHRAPGYRLVYEFGGASQKPSFSHKAGQLGNPAP
jgi:hypothetical protein